jgi:hypothetical protein
VSPLVAALARPEYTGENRCWPCTVLNVVLLAAASVTVAALWPAAGLAVAAIGVALIAARGYLLPYTPVVAPRLAAALPGDLFVHDSVPAGEHGGPVGDATGGRDADSSPDERAGPATLADATEADGESVLDSLVDAGVLRLSGADVVLDGAFEDRWYAEMGALADASPAALADAAAAVAPGDPDARTEAPRDRSYIVLSEGTGESWLRRPVAVVEVAAARALDDPLPAERRAVAAHALGIFLETCPVCGTAIEEAPAGGCCGPPRTDAEGRPLTALVCPDCRAQFAEFE